MGKQKMMSQIIVGVFILNELCQMSLARVAKYLSGTLNIKIIIFVTNKLRRPPDVFSNFDFVKFTKF